ncbi:MAG: LCP family protein [Oscillospiraceae bacterium]|nr:LCP family protein [Oscillospiraceae bacterium]
MKTGKIWTILSVTVLVLLVAAEALATVSLLKLNMLPTMYVMVLAAVMVLVAAGIALLLFVKRKGTVGTTRRVVACVLALLVVCLCGLVTKYTTEALKTVNNVSTGEKVTSIRNMYVLVRAEDPAKTLKDTTGYSFAAIENYEAARVEKITALIGETSGTMPELAGYTKASELADALLGNTVDAIIMNGASIALLIEEEAYETFLDKTKILYTIAYDELDDKETKPTEATKPADPEKNVTNTPFAVYVSGSDTRSSILDVSRSDVNILVVVNPVSKQVLLLNTPRDYFVPNPAGDGALDKLTHCGLYGVDCSMEALEQLYDTKIDYYGQINFTGFETLIDAIGGVTVYSDQSFTTSKVHIKKGENHLNGQQALGFARERYQVIGGDNGRGKNQMKVIKAVIEKLTTGTTVLSNYSAILSSLEGMFSTSLQTSDISMLVKMQLADLSKWEIFSYAVIGTGGSEKTYSAPGHNAYVMYPNEESVATAAALVDKILAGELLTKEDVAVPESK